MKNKKQKRKIKLKGRVKCHWNENSCITLLKQGYHRQLGKKTAKSTKPIKKTGERKKVYPYYPYHVEN